MDQAAKMHARLNDDRALIFRNLLNGVEMQKVCANFRRSEVEVMNIFRFILRKIRSRFLEDLERPIIGETVEEVSRSRIRCFDILPYLNLEKDPRYKEVMYENLEMKRDGSLRNAELLRSLKPEEGRP